MKTTTVLLVGVIASLLVTTSWAATSVKSGKSNSDNRTARQQVQVTSTTALSGPSDTQTVYTTPTTSDFILTGLCVSPIVTGGVRLDVVGFGSIAHVGTLDNGCQTFAQGVLLPRDSAITCSTLPGASPGNYFCTITGHE